MRCKLIMVDMDGTLCIEQAFSPEVCESATPVKEMIDKVNKCYIDNIIIIYTARRDELIPKTLEWLRRNNVRYHAISNIKVPGDVYIDDKMVSISEFLNE